ncbi:ParM/StbA family protein [Undibacterium oligocarboniphilum]|uniref:ParM/StbA family protein n=1 Tax=Undibacterium oligocarboniphilum TaxID=666702 RepID=A0A850QNR6_9BURK|nr:ParM/StbA family protein [Undibacterium oligocarboniphilum]MBC3871401.1 ParM/StbA family protein [Undibacterium oligocarboniphilum]NVO79023.1 ParM/StbA family protein [Undibacterium oligocarboniphilum]
MDQVKIAIDDGHDTMKVCFGFDEANNEYQCVSVKSLAIRGMQQIASLNKEAPVYAADGETFTMVPDNALGRHLDTRFIEYPKSALNRVLVHHALVESGMGGRAVNVVTGLPVDQYYKGGKKNIELINAKIANISKPVNVITKNISLANIVENRVMSEAIAAVFDIVFNGDGSENIETFELISRRPIAVVDMGGKTLDIATIMENIDGIYYDRSGTENIGVLRLKEEVASKLKNNFTLNNEPPSKYVEEAIRTKQYEVFGELHDISELIESVCREYVVAIQNAMLKRIGDGSDLGAVVFVGGGAALLQSVFGSAIFSEIYQGRCIIPNHPQFSNAIGMWKYATFVAVESVKSTHEAEAATVD